MNQVITLSCSVVVAASVADPAVPIPIDVDVGVVDDDEINGDDRTAELY